MHGFTSFEIAFNGGGSIEFKGTLEQNWYSKIRLFQGEVTLGDVPLFLMYSVSELFVHQSSRLEITGLFIHLVQPWS